MLRKLPSFPITAPSGDPRLIIKLSGEMSHDDTGIPRWAIERIERALRDHPEALYELPKELAAEG